MGRVTTAYQRWVPKAAPDMNYPFAYETKCIKSIEELKQVLSIPTDYMSFDTETTGLSPEENFIVGYSLCLDGKVAYYVPVNHYTFQSLL